MKVVWSKMACDDLQHIRSYISDNNPFAAGSVAKMIIAAVNRLGRFPFLGRPGRLPDTRELVVSKTPFIVPYRVTVRGVEIIGVLHGARRWPEKNSG